MAEALKHVALDGLHRELGARMGGFAGYDMPIQYSGLKAEHLATRASCGLFDVSHMGQLLVRPRDGRIETLHAQLEACLPLDFSDWPEGAQRYSLLLNERGGIEDDLMLVNLGSEVRIIVNAGNRDHDFHLLTTRCPELEFTWIDAALIALQGPQAEAVLAVLDPRARSPRFMESVSLELLGVPCFATRSGYTGEDGFELFVPNANAVKLWEALAAAGEPFGLTPAGLAARDSLRLEAGMPLYGHELGLDITPFESGLGRLVEIALEKKTVDFVGRTALTELAKSPSERILVGLKAQAKRPARAGSFLVDAEGNQIGEVTSGIPSPTLGYPIAMALVKREFSEVGSEVDVDIRGKRATFDVVSLPFYKREK